MVPAVPARPCACRSAGVSPRVLRSFARRFQLRQEIHFKHSTISCMYTVSQKNYAKLFLSELHQISTNCDNFWQKDGKEANIMLNALIFHITYFVSSHHRVKRTCSKLLGYTMLKVVICNKLSNDLAHSKLKCGDLFSRIISSYNSSGQNCVRMCV